MIGFDHFPRNLPNCSYLSQAATDEKNSFSVVHLWRPLGLHSFWLYNSDYKLTVEIWFVSNEDAIESIQFIILPSFSFLVFWALIANKKHFLATKAYIKVKRPDQTVFVYATPNDTVETIITRLLEMTKAPFAPEHIKLVYNGDIMDPANTLSQYTTSDGDVVQEYRCHGTFCEFRSCFVSPLLQWTIWLTLYLYELFIFTHRNFFLLKCRRPMGTHTRQSLKVGSAFSSPLVTPVSCKS